VGKLCASLDGDVLERGLQVSTVDAFQGSEREAIVVSLVRSNARGDRGFLDFPVEGARRLNVALSRARKRLVLIGNWETLTASSDTRDDGETCVGVYRDLYAHLVDGGHLPEVLT
jgi:superfamily I DNA and/or RNA helicase